MNALRVASLGLLFLHAAGCYSVDARRVFVIVPPEKLVATVAIGVRDSRPNVQDEQDATYVGMTRSLYGIPYPVYTLSGQSLARDFSVSLANSLATTGVEVARVDIGLHQSREDVIAALREKDTALTLLVDIKKWRMDYYFSVGCDFDLLVSVYDRRGQVLAEESVSGSPDFGRVDYGTGIGIGYAFAINKAFRTDSVQRAMSGRPSTSSLALPIAPRSEPTPPPRVVGDGQCTVDQILVMQRTGLTEGQIKAACE